jgi:hypothetical protein
MAADSTTLHRQPSRQVGGWSELLQTKFYTPCAQHPAKRICVAASPRSERENPQTLTLEHAGSQPLAGPSPGPALLAKYALILKPATLRSRKSHPIYR